ASFRLRKENKSASYTYETGGTKLSAEFEQKFKTNQKAWSFFQTMSPSYQRIANRWVMSAKQETTRVKRLHQLITGCEESRKIKPLSY
ncbi:MAG: YdeI/OmpD-associated family protein, partial [Bacteroidales bacterium]